MSLRSVLSALGIAGAIVLGFDYVSFAASGHSFLLDTSNTSRRTTALTRTTAGAALSLRTTTGSPPLAVNHPTKVRRLNADLLDGIDSGQLARTKAPLQVYVAPSVPGRSVAVGTSTGTAQSVDLATGAECGVSTRHRYLVEYSGWWNANGNVATSATVDSTAVLVGDGWRVASADGDATTAASRLVVLAPGTHTIRLLVLRTSGSFSSLWDPSTVVTDLGYTCDGAPTTTQ